MKNVLIPIDFSKQSINAFRFALDIARKTSGTVHLLHVFDLPVIHNPPLLPITGFKQPLISELKQVAQNKFERLIKEYNTYNITVRTTVTVGRIHPSIIAFIKENAIDLLVMGTKGSNGIREWVIGSNTEKMVRTSPVPLFAIKEYTPADGIKNIVFPTTLDTEDQEELVTKVKILQNFFLATLHIIWVNTPSVFRPDPETRKKLKDFAERYMLKDYTINVFSYTDEESGIVEFTRQIKGDLIAMGTHGLTGLAHFFAGSVAEDVVNHVHFPIWTFCTKSAKTRSTYKES